MVILITYKEDDKDIVSFGIDYKTFERIELPNVSVKTLPCYYSEEYKSYILKESFG